MPVEDVLKASPLFKDFSPTGLQILASIATEKSFPRGTPIFTENMVADSVLFIAEGRVAIGVKNNEGKDTYLASLQPGDHLGELCLLSPTNRMCTALAESDTRCVELRLDAFRKLLAQKPQACLKLMMNVSAEFGRKLGANRDGLRALALAAKG
jgi:CRP-like cAMP-binding protein